MRVVPIFGSAAFVLTTLIFTMWWNDFRNHIDLWWVPGDFWTSYFSSSALIHGHLGSIYAQQDWGGVVTFPGLVVLLAPAVALGQSLHLLVGVPYTAVATPTIWLLLEPFDLLAGCLVLFSIDAVARGWASLSPGERSLSSPM
jgi:hypothetical protein